MSWSFSSILLLCSLLASTQQASADLVLDDFNYVLGTQTIGASYQFTKEPRIVETAKAIAAMGSNVIKFRLEKDFAQKGDAPQADPGIHSLADLALHPAYRQVFQMPFAHYVVWAYPFSFGGFRNGLDQQAKDREYREMYDLAACLLKTYDGSRKTFWLGHWEGDWMLRGEGKPASGITPAAVRGMIDWLNVRQKAVDDAKRDTPHHDVQVFNYCEVNRVADAMKGVRSVTNDVLPEANVDYVSYSCYDTQSGDLAGALDYIASKLRARPGLPGKRVFIGEYGFPARRFSPAEQEQRSRQVMLAGLKWGCPFVLYWEMFNNEVKDGKQVGYWLIDDQGRRQPVYETHAGYYRWARAWVADFSSRHGGAKPSEAEFRREAVKFLENTAYHSM